ncbi:MAG: hypothetical protein ACO39X_05265 [Candidatus Nanopelagicaceae bacterium]|jgi:hypothetical protein
MSRPTPPKPTWTPDDAQLGSQPIASPLRIEDVSPFVDPLNPPVYGAASSAEGEVLCDRCDRCWKMTVAGQFKNRKADGSEFVLTERFCVFKDSLVSLAERNVKECSRFKPLKKEDSDD